MTKNPLSFLTVVIALIILIFAVMSSYMLQRESYPTSVTPGITGKKCILGGCSGQICQSADDPPMVSICNYSTSYACYKSARCEVQENGKCGWTPTLQLSQCINRATIGDAENIPR